MQTIKVAYYDGKRHVVVLSDGQEYVGKTHEQVYSLAARAAKGDVEFMVPRVVGRRSR